MPSEPFFLIDEELLELESLLKDVQFKLDNPDYEKNQLVLRSFVRACTRTLKPKHIPKPIIRRPEKIPIPVEIPKTKQEIKKTRIFPTPRPGGGQLQKIKARTKYTKEELPKNKISLINDKITNKPLAIAELNDKYIVREPPITDNQIKILKKVIKKKPKDPKQAWELLKKTASKLSEDQLTNIKYYLMNSLFLLGRLEPLLNDKKISGIQCNGPGQYVMVRRDGKLLKTNIIFSDREDLDSFLKKLARKLNKSIDEKNPQIDTTHRDYRFQLTIGLHGASSKFVVKKIE